MGNGIHIKKKNRGKFTATKKRTGKSTEELTHSKNPLTRKRAVFAQNARKWNHKKKKRKNENVVRLTESDIYYIIYEAVRNYRTYGLGNFDKALFKRAENNKDRWPRNKPKGGLWASPVDADFGWLDWNKREMFMAYEDDDYFEFVFKDDARIYTIDSREDVARLPQQWDNEEMVKLFGDIRRYGSEFYPDFEKISEEYDAIEYHMNNETYWALYGWDCDSVLVLNPDAIEVVKSNSREAKGHRHYQDLASEKYKDEKGYDDDYEW